MDYLENDYDYYDDDGDFDEIQAFEQGGDDYFNDEDILDAEGTESHSGERRFQVFEAEGLESEDLGVHYQDVPEQRFEFGYNDLANLGGALRFQAREDIYLRDLRELLQGRIDSLEHYVDEVEKIPRFWVLNPRILVEAIELKDRNLKSTALKTELERIRKKLEIREADTYRYYRLVQQFI